MYLHIYIYEYYIYLNAQCEYKHSGYIKIHNSALFLAFIIISQYMNSPPTGESNENSFVYLFFFAKKKKNSNWISTCENCGGKYVNFFGPIITRGIIKW